LSRSFVDLFFARFLTKMCFSQTQLAVISNVLPDHLLS